MLFPPILVISMIARSAEIPKPVELPTTPAPTAMGATPSIGAIPSAIPPEPVSAPPVASDFGAKNGTEIVNKAQILPQIDRDLGQDKPPSVEFLFVRPLSNWKVLRLRTETNPYGHAAVRYTMPGGKQKVMNIVGLKGRELVNFVAPQDYLFGTKVFDGPSEQGGLYNRGMWSLRIEKLPDAQVLALDGYFQDLKRRAEAGEAGFSLAFSDVLNALARITPGLHEERGNCARWTSMGLRAAGLLRAATLWPKSIWVSLFERLSREDPDNIHVVAYRRVKHAVHTYGADTDAYGLVAPLRWLKDRRYWDLEKYADAVVEVPGGTMRAEVRTAVPAWRRRRLP